MRSSGIEANNKVLVFTEFRQTQDFLIRVLNEQGLKCEKVNGSMSMEERHHALVHFRDESDVLVATDAAGESLNMQFCHIIINYDLPWNPMALEQRIGRVDRIGQKYEVQAYNMLTNNSVDYRIYNIIVEKLDLIMEELGIDKQVMYWIPPLMLRKSITSIFNRCLTPNALSLQVKVGCMTSSKTE